MAGEYTIEIHTDLTRSNKKASFSFTVDSAEQAITHAEQIANSGYKRKIDATSFEWIMPSVIARIVVRGNDLPDGYTDADISL